MMRHIGRVSMEESKKCSIAALIMAKKDKEPVNVDADEDEYVVQKEIGNFNG